MPRASRKQMGLENTTPSWYAGPGRVARRVDNPVKIAIKGRIRKGNKK
jgi:hypothetical protein